MISSLFGPLLVTLAHRFHLSLPPLSCSALLRGAFFGVPIGWLSMRRFTGAAVLSGTLLITALARAGALSTTGRCSRVGVLSRTRIRRRRLLPYFPLVRTRTSGRVVASASPTPVTTRAVIGPLLLVVVRPTTFACSTSIDLGRPTHLGNRDSSHHRLREHPAAARGESNETPIILATFIALYLLRGTETTTAGWIAPHCTALVIPRPRQHHTAALAWPPLPSIF